MTAKDIHYAFCGNVVRGKSVLFRLVVRNGFAHFVWKVFARRKLLPGKFLVFAPLIDEGLSFSRVLAKEAGDRGWTVNYLGEIIGHEADNIIVVGPGSAEAVSRARLCVAILLCGEDDYEMRFHYNLAVAQYHEAIEQGLVEVAIPPWHPKVKSIFNIHHL